MKAGNVVGIQEYLESKIRREKERAKKSEKNEIGDAMADFKAAVVVQTLEDVLAFVRRNAR